MYLFFCKVTLNLNRHVTFNSKWLIISRDWWLHICYDEGETSSLAQFPILFLIIIMSLSWFIIFMHVSLIIIIDFILYKIPCVRMTGWSLEVQSGSTFVGLQHIIWQDAVEVNQLLNSFEKLRVHIQCDLNTTMINTWILVRFFVKMSFSTTL